MPGFLIEGVRLIDGYGQPSRPTSSLLIEGDQITKVGAPGSVDAASDVETLELGPNVTVLPGLIDAHVHFALNPDPTRPRPSESHLPVRDSRYLDSRTLLFAAANAEATLAAGFTTVRDVAAPNSVIFPLRDAIAEGELPGPRILASGEAITHTGGHGTEYGPGLAVVADGAEAVVNAVRRQVAMGADVIKFIGGTRPALSPPFKGRPGHTTEEIAAGADEAHRAGLPVAVHAHSDLGGIQASIKAGVDSIEHGFPLDEETADLLAATGTFLCPTLSIVPGGREAIERGLWSYPGSEAHMGRLAQWAPAAVELAHQRGVEIVFGTDAAMPFVHHGSNAGEFALLVACGLSPMEAIVAATSTAARCLGIDDVVGTVESGKQADLLVVDGDPSDDVEILADFARILLVIQGGEIVIDRRG